MAICLICGKEGAFLCNECRGKTDIEKLCFELLDYVPGKNSAFDKAAEFLNSPENIKSAVFMLSASLPSPQKELVRIFSFSGSYGFIPKDSRNWFFEEYPKIKDEISGENKSKLLAIALKTFLFDYRFFEAEETASELAKTEKLSHLCYCALAEYYTRTRRYDIADGFLCRAVKEYPNDERLTMLCEDNERRRTGKHYMPQPEEAREAYVDFMQSLGIEAELPQKKISVPKPIPKEQYPASIETRDDGLSEFVAFDVETTGLYPGHDSMIEIAAVRVKNGVIDEENVFSELVRPYKSKVSDEITEKTGITQEDVANARQMWEVLPDFLDFVGDSVLVGYNNIQFDSKFLERAGRYAHRVIKNPHFDVMRYSGKNKKLEELAQELNIENPHAHRALSDAITTAKVFLALKEKRGGEKRQSLKSVLADIDSWS